MLLLKCYTFLNFHSSLNFFQTPEITVIPVFSLLLKCNRPVLFHIFHLFWQRSSASKVTSFSNQKHPLSFRDRWNYGIYLFYQSSKTQFWL